jgi:hypothetical protein
VAKISNLKKKIEKKKSIPENWKKKKYENFSHITGM